MRKPYSHYRFFKLIYRFYKFSHDLTFALFVIVFVLVTLVGIVKFGLHFL